MSPKVIDAKRRTWDVATYEQRAKARMSAEPAKKIATAKVVSSNSGWRCQVCACDLKDSMTYLNHVNGRKHQKRLGSVRAERSTKEEFVRRRLELVNQQKRKDSVVDYETIIKAQDTEAQRRKQERKRKQRDARNVEEVDNEEIEAALGIEHTEMAALMGFSSFGGISKKKKRTDQVST